MSISPIGTAASAGLQILESLTGSNRATSSGQAASAADAGASTGLSQIGRFFAKLESLAQNSPDQFKQLTAQISSELSSAAQQTTGDAQQFLQQLADRFQTASQTGSTAPLHAAQDSTLGAAGAQAHRHHSHHHHGYSTENSTTNDLASALSGSSATPSSGAPDIGSLFQTIFQQVMQA